MLVGICGWCADRIDSSYVGIANWLPSRIIIQHLSDVAYPFRRGRVYLSSSGTVAGGSLGTLRVFFRGGGVPSVCVYAALRLYRSVPFVFLEFLNLCFAQRRAPRSTWKKKEMQKFLFCRLVLACDMLKLKMFEEVEGRFWPRKIHGSIDDQHWRLDLEVDFPDLHLGGLGREGVGGVLQTEVYPPYGPIPRDRRVQWVLDWQHHYWIDFGGDVESCARARQKFCDILGGGGK